MGKKVVTTQGSFLTGCDLFTTQRILTLGQATLDTGNNSLSKFLTTVALEQDGLMKEMDAEVTKLNLSEK
jgi:hypothetical protein